MDVDVAGLGGGIVRVSIWGTLGMKMGVVVFSVDDESMERVLYCVDVESIRW